MYKLNKDIDLNQIISVIRLEDNAFIPLDPANTDYQAFLLWKAQGNEPTPADEGTQ